MSHIRDNSAISSGEKFQHLDFMERIVEFVDFQGGGGRRREERARGSHENPLRR